MKLATLCYVQNNGKTLMMNRNKKENDMHKGKWNGLGGKLLPGETPEECVVRELKEESGLTLKKPKLMGVITFPSNDQIKDDWYVFVFTASEFDGTLTDSVEGTLEWIDDSNLFGLNTWEGDKIFMKWLSGEKKFSAKFEYNEGRLKRHDVTFY